MFSQARALGSYWALGLPLDASERLVALLRAVTAEQVQAVARRYFGDDQLTVAVLRPQPVDGSHGARLHLGQPFTAREVGQTGRELHRLPFRRFGKLFNRLTGPVAIARLANALFDLHRQPMRFGYRLSGLKRALQRAAVDGLNRPVGQPPRQRCCLFLTFFIQMYAGCPASQPVANPIVDGMSNQQEIGHWALCQLLLC